jgi:hypothetical protein
MNPKDEYIMGEHEVVGLNTKLNLNNMELPFCSGVIFSAVVKQLSKK